LPASDIWREEKKSAFSTAVFFDVMSAVLIFCIQWSWSGSWITYNDVGGSTNELWVGVWQGCLGQYWNYYSPYYWPAPSYWYGYYWYWPSYWTGGCQYWWSTQAADVFGTSYLQAMPSLLIVSFVLLAFCGCIAVPDEVGMGLRRLFFFLSLAGTILWICDFGLIVNFATKLQYYVPNSYWYVRGSFVVGCIATLFQAISLFIKIWVMMPVKGAAKGAADSDYPQKQQWAIFTPPPAANTVYTVPAPGSEQA
jgi:hypothetical protein